MNHHPHQFSNTEYSSTKAHPLTTANWSFQMTVKFTILLRQYRITANKNKIYLFPYILHYRLIFCNYGNSAIINRYACTWNVIYKCKPLILIRVTNHWLQQWYTQFQWPTLHFQPHTSRKFINVNHIITIFVYICSVKQTAT